MVARVSSQRSSRPLRSSSSSSSTRRSAGGARARASQRYGVGRTLCDWVLSAAAGAGLWLSFPDYSLWWLVVPAMAVLVSRVDTAGVWRAGLNATIAGATFFLPLLVWAIPATGGSYAPWIALSLIQALMWGLWGMGQSAVRVWAWTRTVWGQTCALAILWVGVEQMRSSWPWSGFPWGNLAIPQVDSPLGHLAPWGGEVLVSAVTVACAVLLRRACSYARVHESPHWWGRPLTLLCAVGLFAAPGLIPLSSAQENGAVRVGAIQGNIEIPALATYAIAGKVTANHAQVMREALDRGERMDLAVWGESSVDRDPRVDRGVGALLSSTVNHAGIPTVVGFTSFEDSARYNWVGVWYPGTGGDPHLYGKQIPVPFGEYIPLRQVIARLATEAAQVGVDLRAVHNSSRMDIHLSDGRTLPVAMGICFEVAYEGLLAEGVRSGGELIVIPSNNYHFGTYAEGAQQVQILRFRALEFSRSAVQASTTGNSALIRPDGGIQLISGRMVPATLIGDLPLRTGITWSAWLGNIPSVCVMVTTAVWILVAWGRTYRVYRRTR